MKKILLSTICCIILSGCAKTFYSENVSMLDFRKYAKEGFIINPKIRKQSQWQSQLQ